ncbi:hypothetical protein Tco_0334107, partial [Tanacetum coccineum]
MSTICSRYEIRESSTARPARGQGIDYGFVSTVDAEERRQGIRNVGYGIRDTREGDRMDGGGGGLCFPQGLGSFDRIEPG